MSVYVIRLGVLIEALVTFLIDKQCNHVVGRAASDAWIIHYLFNQEEAPPARRWLVIEFGLQVGCLRHRDGLLTPVRDPLCDDLLGVQYRNPNLHPQFRPNVVAVLDSLAYRLGHGGLKPLQARGGEAQFLHCLDDSFHRHARVAWHAGQREVCKGTPGRIVIPPLVSVICHRRVL